MILLYIFLAGVFMLLVSWIVGMGERMNGWREWKIAQMRKHFHNSGDKEETCPKS